MTWGKGPERTGAAVSPAGALLDGVVFTAQDYTPAKSAYAGKLCHGILITITDRDKLRPLAVFRHIDQVLYEFHRREFQWRWEEARKLTGSSDFQRIYAQGHDLIQIMELFNLDAEKFEKSRRACLLY